MNGSQYIWILNGISLMLTSAALAGYPIRNVALNRNAEQSSTRLASGTADKAIDGNGDPHFNHGSCTITHEESDPWWRVKLGRVYKIHAITITNRDQHESRLDGAEIWIGNSEKIIDNKNIRCGVISHIPKGRTIYFLCSGIAGRYVTVLLRGSNKTLSLCEVEVFDAGFVYPFPNRALRGDATQSSTLSFAAASKAIDGRRNSFYSQGSCSHTAEQETNPWWRVDLKQTYIVTSIKITNRGDCCAERLDGAEIRIGNSQDNNGNNNPRCVSISHIRAGKTYTFHCDGGSMAGRFVNVIIPGEKKTLTLCEVEVYGVPEVESVPDVALYKPVEQSSSSSVIISSQPASNAISQCSNQYPTGCCSQTPTVLNPWWRVDLLAMHKVVAVSILNMHDCCPEMAEGAQIRIADSLSNIDKKPRCVTISRKEKTLYTFFCSGEKGRYVHVHIPDQLKALTVCQVKVYASLEEPKLPSSVPSPTPLVPPTSPPPPPPPPATVSLQLSGRNVTVVGEKLCWADALFYCRRHYWDLLSLHSQEERSEVEQLLSHSPFPITGFVWLGLRRYLMRETWFWMSGGPMSIEWPQRPTPHNYPNPCGGMAGGGRHLWDDQPCEMLLNFICQTRAADHANRVYFYSTRYSP